MPPKGLVLAFDTSAAHCAAALLLPDGRVLSYGTDGQGRQGAQFQYDVWDPADGTGAGAHLTLPNTTGADTFCSGQIVWPASGAVLLTGGDRTVNGERNYSINDVNLFDWRTNALYSAQQPMAQLRWYPTVLTLASGDTARDIAEAQHMLEIRRHRVFKLKIGAGEVDRDLAHVIAIKKALGDRASVRVDVNQAWDEAVALRACRILGGNGIDLIEQPISRNNRSGMVRLNASSPAPIMADESIECVEDAFNLAREGAASVFALKIAKNGGPRAVLRTAQIAEAAGIALYGGTMLEGAIGTLASAHAFVTLRQLTWGTELFGPLLLTEEIVTEAPVYRDFALQVPRTKPELAAALAAGASRQRCCPGFGCCTGFGGR